MDSLRFTRLRLIGVACALIQLRTTPGNLTFYSIAHFSNRKSHSNILYTFCAIVVCMFFFRLLCFLQVCTRSAYSCLRRDILTYKHLHDNIQFVLCIFFLFFSKEAFFPLCLSRRIYVAQFSKCNWILVHAFLFAIHWHLSEKIWCPVATVFMAIGKAISDIIVDSQHRCCHLFKQKCVSIWNNNTNILVFCFASLTQQIAISFEPTDERNRKKIEI